MTAYRPSSRDDFEIAIICALPLECDAVDALFDEDYEENGPSYGKAPGDKNAYTIGRCGKQHVVLAHMPGMGTVNSAAVAVNLNLSFRKIKIAFLVGICGGIPVNGSQNAGDAEIRLGDTIISTSVVQIDFGRRFPNGFERKKGDEEVLGRANPEIRTFLGKLSGYRSQARLRDRTFTLLHQALSTEDFASAAYPGSQYDIIYAADHRHKHWNLECKTCNECKTNDDEVCELALTSDCIDLGCQGMTARDTSEVRKPAVHFGRIACGNQVIKSGIHRDRLAVQEKVIGFEMESAGTWDFVPTVVVKSVCDYADSHKSKRWQRYAALTAAACTKAILEVWRNVEHQDQELPVRPDFPAHTTITRPVSTLFTGRHDILNNLKSIIQMAVRDSQQDLCHIVISGMGGQGKSEICLQVAHQLRNLFWGIFWVDVSTTTSAQNGFLDIGSRLGFAASTWEAVRLELANTKQPWLLVLDNADDPEIDYEQYFPVNTFGVILLTSRNAECERYATKRWIDLEGLAHTDARDLLFRAARIPDTRRESFLTYAQEVTQILQSHPLALIQAGSYISHRHCSLKEYPQVYERQRKRLLAFRPDQARSRYRDVYTTFEASAETLRSSTTAAARDALNLLALLAIYGPNRLPVFIFEAAWREAQDNAFSDVADNHLTMPTMWHVTRLPAFFQIRATTWDSFYLVEALNLLKAFSLVSVDGEANSLSVSMHPLVHAWARDRLSIEQQHTSWVQAGCVFVLLSSENKLWANHMRQLQPHLQALTSWPMSTMFSSDPKAEICRILVICGWTLSSMQDDRTTFTLLSSLRAYLDLDPSVVTTQWLDIYQLTATNSCSSGLIKNAVKLQEQIVKIREQTLAEEHPDRLTSQHELAAIYEANGQVQEAVELLEQVVKIREHTLEEDHPHRLASQHELAGVYRVTGQTQKAIELLEQVVKIREQTLEEGHPHLLTSRHELAGVYRVNGQIQKAIELLEEVVRIREHTLEKDHPHRLVSQQELATAYKANGQVQEAVELLELVVKIQEQTLEEHHPDRLASQHELARVYRATGKVHESIKLLEQVVKIHEHTLEKDHPSRLASQHNLAGVYGATGQLPKAVELLEQVIEIREETLEEDHPDLLASQHELARMYEANGQVQEAVRILEQVTKIEERTLAIDDPSRLISQEVLASSLWKLGKKEKAVDLMRHVVNVQRQSLNDGHPTRVRCEEWLGMMTCQYHGGS